MVYLAIEKQGEYVAVMLRGGSKLGRRSRSGGFALPTILIASVVMLIVLLFSVSSATTVRTAVKEQYYQQLAQIAGEAGIAYAQACLDANNGVPLWTDAKPLTPNSDCSGNVLSSPKANILVVAGGGGGGSDMGGGGGGGGVLTDDEFTLNATTYSVTVGAGGAGAAAGAGQARGANGGNSIFGTMTAIGGGGGASRHDASTSPAGNGGSGGGASGGARLPSGGENGTGGYGGGIRGTGTAGQGYDGGTGSYAWFPGGGGGAGGIGSTFPAHGGPGVLNDILGTPYYWGGGGGGSGYSGIGGNGGIGGGGGGAVGITTGGPGLNAGFSGGGGVINSQTNFPGGHAGANTGGGGGGGSHYSANNRGGNGGSGIVVISYPTGSVNATGGTVTYAKGNTIHSFTTTGPPANFQVSSITGYSCPSDPRCAITVNGSIRSSFSIGASDLGSNGNAKILVVGGGGSGGGGWQGGGGGAGGYVYEAARPLTPQSYVVTVGDGGPGGGTPTCGWGRLSSFGGIINAVGGGCGAGEPSGGNASPRVGGSGGGGSHGAAPGPTFVGLGIPGQGNNGGQGISVACPCVGGGGGGAGAVGQNATTTKGGDGGIGIANSITGSSVYYAGGGGGSLRGGTGGAGGNGGGGNAGGTTGANGAANTGGGGGAGQGGAGAGGVSGTGGSGVVIVAYPTGSMTATGGTVTTAGGDTIHRFTSSGTFEVTQVNNVAKTLPNTGYVELLRTSNDSVWRRYEQKATPPTVVADQCSGEAKSIYGWNNAAVSGASTFTPEPLAKYVSVSSSQINPGTFYLRKDFSVTKPGTYILTSAVDDIGTIWLDDNVVGSTNGTTLTQSVNLTAGCHTLLIKVVNEGVLPSFGNAALSLKKSDASTPLVVTDQTWRVSSGNLVHFSTPNYYVSPLGWENAVNVRLSMSGDANWQAQTGDVYARFIASPEEYVGGNSPFSKWTNFRDSRDITVASNTSVKVGVQCDDNCKVYLDGEVIIASAAWSSDYTTTVTLTPGTHKFGVSLYNGGAAVGASGFSFAAVRVSDGVSISVSDPSWQAAKYWDAVDQDPFSYDNTFRPNPDTLSSVTARVLVVGGGGGGGADMGGGGGGGGVVYNGAYNLRSGVYNVEVGAGGAGAPNAAGAHPSVPGSNGGDSVFDTIVAIGGGRAGLSHNDMALAIARGVSGGSGGGASGYNNNGAALGIVKGGLGIEGQGHAGGNQGTAYYSGGGGGAGGPGASGNSMGNGGVGVQNSILGTSYYWGGGGGGSGYSIGGGAGGLGGGGGGAVGSPAGVGGTGGINNGFPGTNGCTGCAANVPGGNGAPNTGGGGGGGSHYTSNNRGGNGGSGIVVISYPTGSMNATGGTVTTSGGYTIHTFLSSGMFTVTPSAAMVQVLAVGGGGSGGSSTGSSGGGGGGGAGGLGYFSTSVAAGQSYPIVVGAGGAAVSVASTNGNNGGNTSFGFITVLGGGGGGRSPGAPGNTGGSGGGAGYNSYAFMGGALGTPGQGNKGGDVLSNNNGGGGGGAGAVGGNTNSTGGAAGGLGGVGGAGLAYSISGASVTYARGGDGGTPPGGANNGAANTGNGGTGIYGTAATSGSGGSGVVIISYPTGSLTATGGTITTSGGNRIHRFTSNGTFTVTAVN